MEGLSNLQDAIQRDLAWRKREISDIRALVARVDDAAEYVFRSGQVLLCAHWEGFLKKSAKLYIDHVFSQDLRLTDLIPSMISIAYFDAVMLAATAKYPGSDGHHIKLAKKIVATINEKVSVSGWDVDTEGNPGSDTLSRILKSIGVDVQLGMDNAVWATTKVFINEQLVRDRHRVAHGEGHRIGRASFLERSERLLNLLDVLSGHLLDAAENKIYKVVA